jgi:hypothetical protein
MAKAKVDGVVEAVRYDSSGKVQWVRVYLRRGPTYSDHLLLDRDALIQQMKSGKSFVAGERVAHMASTFNLAKPLRLVKKGDREILVTADAQAEKDTLEGVPLV